MNPLDTTTDQGTVRPSRQALWGVVLLLAGGALSVLLVQSGANALSSIGIVIGVAGIVLLGNAFVERTRGVPDDSPSDEVDGRALLAMALAVLVPPLGVLVGAGTPYRRRRLSALATLAVAVGSILTVVYTFGFVLAGALSRT